MKTIFVVAAILAVGALVAYALPTQVYADESETSTEQKIKQKNSGGDGSTNVNCADNDINSPSPFDVHFVEQQPSTSVNWTESVQA